MAQNTNRIAGRHFLQIPGPSPVPDRILRAMDRAIIDHRGPEFQKLAKRVLDGIKSIFKCSGPVEETRQAIDASRPPALFIVDPIPSLASPEYRHDEWGVDVSIGGAQKGLMLPPGMSFNAIGPKALAASENARLPKSFFAWDDMIAASQIGFFPYTPATNMLHGLSESLDMLHE